MRRTSEIILLYKLFKYLLRGPNDFDKVEECVETNRCLNL